MFSALPFTCFLLYHGLKTFVPLGALNPFFRCLRLDFLCWKPERCEHWYGKPTSGSACCKFWGFDDELIPVLVPVYDIQSNLSAPSGYIRSSSSSFLCILYVLWIEKREKEKKSYFLLMKGFLLLSVFCGSLWGLQVGLTVCLVLLTYMFVPSCTILMLCFCPFCLFVLEVAVFFWLVEKYAYH